MLVGDYLIDAEESISQFENFFTLEGAVGSKLS